MVEDLKISKGTRTVTVRSKHPNGLLLRIFRQYDTDVPAAGGGTVKEKISESIGEPVKINGSRIPLTLDGTPREVDYLIVGGYALTPNVDAEFFATWLQQNKDSMMVKNELIGYAATEEAARKDASERKAILSGLEPLVPDTDVRIPRRVDGKKAVTSANVAA